MVTKHIINDENNTGIQRDFDCDNIKILYKKCNYFKIDY